MKDSTSAQLKERDGYAPTSTVGRGKSITLAGLPAEDVWANSHVNLSLADSIAKYAEWPSPKVIVSDGAYGVLGFEGDTSDHLTMAAWYEPHVKAWSARAQPSTTLWFWNSEIGWATVHPLLEQNGWRYVNANIWDKGKGHIAGNVNTSLIRRFPVVTEVCVQYVFEARLDSLPLKKWLLREWKRTGLPMREANKACGVADAAVRKYLDQGHLWYFPPPEKFAALSDYANEHGAPNGRPYFARNGLLLTAEEWSNMRAHFDCPHGFTNVWTRPALRGDERVTTDAGRAVHLNQKPLDLMRMIIQASSAPEDPIWEPFGGLFSASLAAYQLGRRAYAAELDSTYFQFGIDRFRVADRQHQLL